MNAIIRRKRGIYNIQNNLSSIFIGRNKRDFLSLSLSCNFLFSLSILSIKIVGWGDNINEYKLY